MAYYANNLNMLAPNCASMSRGDNPAAPAPAAPTAPAPAVPAAAPTVDPMDVNSLELEEITLVGGQLDHLLEGEPQGHRCDRGQGQREGRGHREGHRAHIQ